MRERKEDLAGLIRFFWEKFGGPVTRKEIPPQVLEELMAHHWPGNVRELQNVILRFLAIGELSFQPVTFQLRAPGNQGAPTGAGGTPPAALSQGPAPEPVGTLAEIVARAERDGIIAALGRSCGRKDRAAALLGVNIRTFHRKCASYGL